MRVSTGSLATLSVLSALATSADAGFFVEEPPYCGYLFSNDVCGCNIACISDESYGPCSPEAAAEFELVAPLLQQCEDISYYFNRVQWPARDRDLFCDINSPCGMLVPYIRNMRPNNRLCGPYEQYKYVLATFNGYCRYTESGKMAGDNGLLKSLKSTASLAPKPTPAPTHPVDAETPEPIPNNESPQPATKSITTGTTKPDEKSTDANAKATSGADGGSVSRAVAAVAVLVVGAIAV